MLRIGDVDESVSNHSDSEILDITLNNITSSSHHQNIDRKRNPEETCRKGERGRAVDSKSIKVRKSLKIRKNRIKLEKSDLISY